MSLSNFNRERAARPGFSLVEGKNAGRIRSRRHHDAAIPDISGLPACPADRNPPGETTLISYYPVRKYLLKQNHTALRSHSFPNPGSGVNIHFVIW